MTSRSILCTKLFRFKCDDGKVEFYNINTFLLRFTKPSLKGTHKNKLQWNDWFPGKADYGKRLAENINLYKKKKIRQYFMYRWSNSMPIACSYYRNINTYEKKYLRFNNRPHTRYNYTSSLFYLQNIEMIAHQSFEIFK